MKKSYHANVVARRADVEAAYDGLIGLMISNQFEERFQNKLSDVFVRLRKELSRSNLS